METDLGEIAHLDFETEQKEEPKKPVTKHYTHPTDPWQAWCGVPFKTKSTYGAEGGGKTPREAGVTCVDCLHLYIEKGGNWWWRVHNAWYGKE